MTMPARRILTRRPERLTHRFTARGRDNVSVSSVEVTVTDAAGDTLLNREPASTDNGTWEVTVDPIDAVTVLDVEWHATVDGKPRVDRFPVEAAAGVYVTVAELASREEFTDQERFPDELLDRVLLAVERRIETATGVAWVPRHRQARLTGDDSRTIVLPDLWPRAILHAAVDGDAVDTDERAEWQPLDSGVVRLPRALPRRSVVDVRYECGADAPPEDLRHAASEAAAQTALETGHSGRPTRRTESVVHEGHTINFSAVADLDRGRPFGMPDIDAVVMSYARRKALVM